ncbi:hypothetical protein [Cesiribacter andamanensis]|uniref:SpoIIAA-like protein n=1 Tax=Cesiribacter andamanensis AMV16 TaxID=1279009 RepID=M7N2U8_9BACT|nr:hypothetical protein [Cesiribacter andamanensis]EMR01546.1 hypothetical protein ADICEAN_03331 [Cesiribacter andamanensis AMV16]
MQKLFEGKTCQAEFLPERKLVFCSLIGATDAAEHQAMDQKVRDLMQATPVVAFAHDLRQMSGTLIQFNGWLLEALRPTVALGLRYHALVMGGELFRKIAATEVLQRLAPVQYSIFDSREKAERWIDKKLEQLGG